MKLSCLLALLSGADVQAWWPLSAGPRCCSRESEVFCAFRWISTHALCHWEPVCHGNADKLHFTAFSPSTISIKKRFKVEKCILIHGQRKSCAKAIIFRAYLTSYATWLSEYAGSFFCLFVLFLSWGHCSDRWRSACELFSLDAQFLKYMGEKNVLYLNAFMSKWSRVLLAKWIWAKCRLTTIFAETLIWYLTAGHIGPLKHQVRPGLLQTNDKPW